MHIGPAEGEVLYGGDLADDVDFQRNGDGEPDDADGEEAHEAGPVGVAVGQQAGEVAAVAVQADENENCRRSNQVSQQDPSTRDMKEKQPNSPE